MSYSIREILNVTIPAVLTALSMNLMNVADKIILMNYSIDAMNAVNISGNMVSIISYMFVSMACTAEIFVGQYNGAKQPNNLARPVWQMVYLSLFANLIFIPFGIFSEYLNMLPAYYEDDGIAYQSILIYFCSVPCMTAAISSFFVGQGKLAVVSIAVLIGNLLNVVLDIVLVFGINGVIPNLGAKGAAIATVISEIIQLAILICVFFRQSNRKIFKIFENMRFDRTLFKKCCKIGFPMSIGRLFEISAWYFIYVVLGHVSKEMATVHGIASTVFTIFAFLQEGLSKAISTLSANLIGMKNLDGVKRIFRIFVIITLCISALTAIPLVIFPEFLFNFQDMTGNDISSFHSVLRVLFKIIVLDIFLETLGCITWGILMSGGDTRYPIIANLLCLWGTVVIPVIIMYYCGALDSVILVWKLCILWCISSLFFMYKRYRSLKWYNSVV
ncbi:MAG: MATE family efflux transporter [Holosporales bacterium]|jgi:MATE family multidrug resistance protein|nr:MATE family efflux transporter [Holosporales bacterium]